ncbi:PREDICTED: autophagy-related [Prunus dulcis]|uniref:Autophagy-related protein n=1 Tax=Prunus dulcis TaxID=3755 RepID=A0A5E4F9F2_PRUDU|nr:PREDICTED: autophagy-related [Prunus dulcis]
MSESTTLLNNLLPLEFVPQSSAAFKRPLVKPRNLLCNTSTISKTNMQVTLEKDPRSDIPDTDMKKFLVYGDMPLRDFVSFIRMRIRVSRKKRIFVYCRNTEPPFDALMSTIDEENKDEDGFLHITFSGEGRVSGSNEEQ